MYKPPRVVLMIESSRKYGQSLLRGIITYSHMNGPWLFYCEHPWETNTLNRIRDWKADGIIAHILNKKKAQQIIDTGLPIVISGAIPDKFYNSVSRIEADNDTIAKKAAEYFLDRGFRHFGFYGYNYRKPHKNEWSEQRGVALQKYITAAGYDISIFRHIYRGANFTVEQEFRALADWLTRAKKPLALVAANDDCAQFIVDACRVANFSVPTEIAILGVDNDELICDLTHPSLSSLELNSEKGGFEAAALLDQLIHKQKIESKKIILHPLDVVTRKSTDQLVIDDETVSLALRFIHDNSYKPIQVSDVATAISTSRRCIERRFRQHMGRSVLSEIKKVRSTRICWMLLKTNLHITQIALKMGFPTAGHLARFFRSEKQCSPLEYRARHQHNGLIL